MTFLREAGELGCMHRGSDPVGDGLRESQIFRAETAPRVAMGEHHHPQPLAVSFNGVCDETLLADRRRERSLILIASHSFRRRNHFRKHQRLAEGEYSSGQPLARFEWMGLKVPPELLTGRAIAE